MCHATAAPFAYLGFGAAHNIYLWTGVIGAGVIGAIDAGVDDELHCNVEHVIIVVFSDTSVDPIVPSKPDACSRLRCTPGNPCRGPL